jgi:hypothetical protein
MTDRLTLMVGSLAVAAIGYMLGLWMDAPTTTHVCAWVVGVLGVGIIWSWLASHNIFVFPGFIVSKYQSRPRKPRS